MVPYYMQLFVPTKPVEVPDDAVVRALSTMVEHGWFAKPVTFVVQRRALRSGFFEREEQMETSSLDELSGLLGRWKSIDVGILATTTTECALTATPLGRFTRGTWSALTEPATIAFQFSRRTKLVSTSGYDVEADLIASDAAELTPYGYVCARPVKRGLFVHPDTLETIAVPGAGCANSWCAVTLYDWVSPRMPAKGLDLGSTPLIELLSKLFSSPIAQGCRWE